MCHFITNGKLPDGTPVALSLMKEGMVPSRQKGIHPMRNPKVQVAIAGGIASLGFAIPKKYPSIRAACWIHGITLGVPALLALMGRPDTPPGLYPG